MKAQKACDKCGRICRGTKDKSEWVMAKGQVGMTIVYDNNGMEKIQIIKSIVFSSLFAIASFHLLHLSSIQLIEGYAAFSKNCVRRQKLWDILQLLCTRYSYIQKNKEFLLHFIFFNQMRNKKNKKWKLKTQNGNKKNSFSHIFQFYRYII